MIPTGSSPHRLVIAASIVLTLTVIALAGALIAPDTTLAQSKGHERPNPDLVRTIRPPQPHIALRLNPTIATPEPGTAEVEAAPPAGDSDLEVVRFRPNATLRRGESLLATGDEKPADTVGPSSLDKPLGAGGGNPEAYRAPDIGGLLSTQDWTPLLYENFVGFSPPALGVGFPPAYGTSVWTVYDDNSDGYERSWGSNDFTYYYHEDDPSDTWSAWPAAAGADGLDPNVYYYPNNLNSWMIYGPIDLSEMADVFVSFGMWYETEPVFDQVFFGASINGTQFYGYGWSGDSGGWTDHAYWLTSYAGYSEVWLAWVFQSDSSIVDDGPFVDEVWVWGDEGGAPPVEPTPDPAGELIQNGSFEDGLTHWTGTGEVAVTGDTSIHEEHSAVMGPSRIGVHFLHQAFDVPSDVTDVVLDFWFRVRTDETEIDHDLFCVSMRPTDLGEIWVDLGCVDALDTTGEWQEVLYTLDAIDLSAVAGQPIALVFELYDDFYGQAGAGGTTGWVDDVSVYATGGGGGGYIDPNEPNDDSTEATSINCGDTITGTIGEAAGGYDVDWFELGSVPAGRIDVDIDADTQVPPSALDSVVGLWDEGLGLVAWNDDDGTSFDSYVVYTNTTDSATFYISVESYWGDGGPNSFYDLTVQCGGSGSEPSSGIDQPNQPLTDTWTVMLYLNAEDPGFVSILNGYRTDIEGYIGSKSDFLTVAILYDGPGANDTTRYLVQPNGNYTLGTNKWNLGERNMGHSDTLANFVTWAMDQYPAENYYLAIDDHGDGVYGISWDATSDNDQLTPPELYSALKSATQNGDRKIDILDYEACLMGLAENAYDVREWVDYVIFFEQISWGINTYPLYFQDLQANDTSLSVGQRIVDRYYAEAVGANYGSGYPHTISLIDTSQMAAVSAAVSGFGDALQATANVNNVTDARDNSQAFAADMDATNPLRAEYIDLWDLADNARGLAPSQAAAVKSAVDAAVVHERHASGGASGYIWDHSGAHGLSIYYPPTKSSSAYDDYVAPSIYQMSRDGTWDEFLTWAVPSGNRRGMSASRSEIKLTGVGDAFVFKYAYLPTLMK